MKKQFGLAAVALTATMALTFTACGGDSSSSSDEPTKVAKVEDLSEDCEDGEEALVGEDEAAYTCVDGKWEADEVAKSSSSKKKSSSSKAVESSADEECDEDVDDCDEEGDEEDETPSSSSKKKPSSASSDDEGGSGSGGGSGSDPEPETCKNTGTQTCIDGKLVDNTYVENCDVVPYDNRVSFCYTDDDSGDSQPYPYCTGKKNTLRSSMVNVAQMATTTIPIQTMEQSTLLKILVMATFTFMPQLVLKLG